MSKSIMISSVVLDALVSRKSVDNLLSFDAVLRDLLGIPQRPAKVPKLKRAAGRPVDPSYAPMYQLAVGESYLLAFIRPDEKGEPINYHAVRSAYVRAVKATGFRLRVEYKYSGWMVTRVA
jgi:hypothetical protein